ncbi:MAG: ABC transporter permease [Deferribacteres bacterium]|nr:ABC transporter permease [candidate division KSB1 bacterium]MCB9503551.1 ABC transporter permease [Deferribacteres bacterium]
MNKTIKRIIAIARKEMLHIKNDPRSLSIILLMPVFQLIMFGYALNTELQYVDLAVIDYSHSTASHDLVQKFTGSPFFHVYHYEGQFDKLDELFLSREARVVLLIGQDFASDLATQTQSSVQILIDAVDPNAAHMIRNYCSQVIQNFNAANNISLPTPFQIETSVWFNPDMKSAYFFVPGLLALLLIMICALLTSITITREKELGTMEQILVSPVQPQEIILGKVIPYVFISFIIAGLILFIGIWLFGVPFVGNLILLTILSLVYVLTALSLGILISTITQTQQVAMMIALVITLMPTVILSGFIFPIASMPLPLQYLANIIPARWYLTIVRGIILKGNTLQQLIQPTLVLLGMTLLLLAIARRKFSANLEK